MQTRGTFGALNGGFSQRNKPIQAPRIGAPAASFTQSMPGNLPSGSVSKPPANAFAGLQPTLNKALSSSGESPVGNPVGRLPKRRKAVSGL